MSAGVMCYDHRRAVGLPGAAIRIGQLLEQWGRRASRPLDRDEARRRREHEQRIEQHRAAADRAFLLRIF